MPFDGIWLPEMLLRRLIERLEVTWFSHTAKVFFVRLVINRVLAQRGISIFQGQRITIEPENRLSPCQSLFRIESPPTKTRIAKAIEGAQKACGVKDAMKLIRGAYLSCHPVQDLCGCMAVVIPIAVSPMWLLVKILDKTPVGLFCALPGCHLREMIITHPSRNLD